jgi:hypothetical protein
MILSLTMQEEASQEGAGARLDRLAISGGARRVETRRGYPNLDGCAYAGNIGWGCANVKVANWDGNEAC